MKPTPIVPQYIIDRIEEFDPSDDYHDNNPYNDFESGYYAGVHRVVRLLKGEITDWMDK